MDQGGLAADLRPRSCRKHDSICSDEFDVSLFFFSLPHFLCYLLALAPDLVHSAFLSGLDVKQMLHVRLTQQTRSLANESAAQENTSLTVMMSCRVTLKTLSFPLKVLQLLLHLFLRKQSRSTRTDAERLGSY